MRQRHAGNAVVVGEGSSEESTIIDATSSAEGSRGFLDFAFSDMRVEGKLAKRSESPRDSMPGRSAPMGNFAGSPPMAAADSPAPLTPAVGPPAPKPAETPTPAAGPRLVIYRGDATVLVAAVEESVKKLSTRVAELTGYVENQNGNAGENRASVTLRVPAERFHSLVEELGTYGQVTQKNISATDVTKQVFDVELRLETAERSRQRLLDLLKLATKMEEILKIEAEVRRLTDEIEGMKGELRFLRDQVAFSTLTVNFYSNAPPPTSPPHRTSSRFGWINDVGIDQVEQTF